VLPDFGAARPVLEILQMISCVFVVAHRIPPYGLHPLKASQRSKPYHCSRLPELPAGSWNGISVGGSSRTPSRVVSNAGHGGSDRFLDRHRPLRDDRLPNRRLTGPPALFALWEL
jgi:hypothetical protein